MPLETLKSKSITEQLCHLKSVFKMIEKLILKVFKIWNMSGQNILGERKEWKNWREPELQHTCSPHGRIISLCFFPSKEVSTFQNTPNRSLMGKRHFWKLSRVSLFRRPGRASTNFVMLLWAFIYQWFCSTVSCIFMWQSFPFQNIPAYLHGEQLQVLSWHRISCWGTHCRQSDWRPRDPWDIK